MADHRDPIAATTRTTADGEFEYEPTAPYVLSKPDDDWCYAIVRTEDGVVMGTDGWQQMGVIEDATFRRDLAWVLVELNRLASENGSHTLRDDALWPGGEAEVDRFLATNAERRERGADDGSQQVTPPEGGEG